MPTCPSPHLCRYLLSSLSLSLSSPLLSLPPFILPSLPLPSRSSSVCLCRHPLSPDATRERNPIRAPLALSLPRLFSRNVSSRFDPRDHPSLPPPPSTADFSSSPFPSQGFSPFFRAHPRSFPLPPTPHCASFHPRPSLASSRSFRRLCQWRDPRPFFRGQFAIPRRGLVALDERRLLSIL